MNFHKIIDLVMKKISKLTVVLLAICSLCVGCKAGVGDPKCNGDVGENLCLFYDLNSVQRLWIIPEYTDYGLVQLSAELICLLPPNPVWQELNNIPELEKYASNQLKEHRAGQPPIVECDQLFGQLTDIVITSDSKIDGIAAGENLIELFRYSTDSPLFSYPGVELVENYEDKMRGLSFDELIRGNYFFDNDFGLVANIDNVEILSSAKFKMTVKLSNGLENYEFTEEFNLVAR